MRQSKLAHRASDEVEHQAPEGPPVDHLAVPPALGDLPGHVRHAPRRLARVHRAILEGSVPRGDVRSIEVRNARVPVRGVEEDVLGLDVAMDDAHPVEGVYAQCLCRGVRSVCHVRLARVPNNAKDIMKVGKRSVGRKGEIPDPASAIMTGQRTSGEMRAGEPTWRTRRGRRRGKGKRKCARVWTCVFSVGRLCGTHQLRDPAPGQPPITAAADDGQQVALHERLPHWSVANLR